MANNIGMTREAYQFFRGWLRTTDILWRDVIDAAIIPAWRETACRKDVLDDKGRTPGERAYQVIRSHYPNLDLRWRKSELELLSARPPKLFRAYYHGELYCLDVRSAFQQIYSRLYLHSDYPNKRLRYPLLDIAKSLSSDKQGRNAVVGIARSTQNKWVQGEKTWYVKKQNRYLSPTLWAQIMGVLNQCASIAITNGAIYVNTDGYAFRTEQEREGAASKLQHFGLTLSQFSGEGEILGISSLFIPGVKEPLEQNVSQPTFHLEPIDFGWLEWWSSLPS